MHIELSKTTYISKVIALILSTLVACGQIFGAQVAHASAGDPASASPVQIIVKFRRSVNNLSNNGDKTDVMARFESSLMKNFAPLSGDAIRVQVDAANVDSMLGELSARADVEFAEIDEVFTPLALVSPSDPRFNEQVQIQTGEFNANLPTAWGITTGAPTVTVAVLDTGVRFDHPEFANRLVAGYDFVTNLNNGNDGDGRDKDANDPGDWVTPEESTTAGSAYNGCPVQNSTWHGTAMAGLIGATGNNGQGVAGINWQSKILPVRVMGKCGGSSSDIADAIRWTVGLNVPGVPVNPNPAQVLNLSLGRPGRCSSTLQSAINDANGVGAIIVVAAGNNGINAQGNSPANCSGVITVGASTIDGNRPFYSSYGEGVDIAAPGGDATFGSTDALLSLSNAGESTPTTASYASVRGTSISAALVSGIVSLMKSVQPSLSTSEVTHLLQQTAASYANAESCSDFLCASGIVNAGAAVQAAYDFKRLQFTSSVFLPALFQDSRATNNQLVGSDVIVAVPNGNFEQVNLNWSSQGTSVSAPVIATSGQLPGGVKPYEGDYAAWLGGANNIDSRIEQTLIVPVDATRLSFYARIQSSDTGCKGDFAFLQINGVTVQRYALCYASQTNDWVRRTVDLSAYTNQQVNLTIRVTTNATDASQVFIDALQFGSR